MHVSPKMYSSRREKLVDFGIGFGGWWVCNMVLFAATGLLLGLVAQLIAAIPPETRQNFSSLGYILPCGIPLVIDAIVLAFLFAPRRYIVFGAITGFVATVILAGSLLAASVSYFYIFIYPRLSNP